MNEQPEILTDSHGGRWEPDPNGSHGWWWSKENAVDLSRYFSPWPIEDRDGRKVTPHGGHDDGMVFYRYRPIEIEVEVNVYEAAARIVRATINRDLTRAEAERLRGLTDAGVFRAAWEK